MDNFRYRLGQRLKSYRIHKGLSQEKLAELADCHPTYIGQLERGEKNATMESVLKLSKALGISLSDLFYKLDVKENEDTEDTSVKSIQTYPLLCYELLLSKPVKEQERLYNIIVEIEKYKGNLL